MKETFFHYADLENKECVKAKPYVVSADIRILLQPWADEKGFVLPNSDFFGQIRTGFSSYMKTIFPGFELVGEAELTNGLTNMVKTNGVFPISLDRVYYRTEPSLDIARMVDNQGNDRGLSRRADSPALLSQFRELRKLGLIKIALVDDVIFTGDLLKRVSGLLERMGIEVPLIYAGIGISEGVNKLSSDGKKVLCVKQYSEVIDEICERDFYPGVPLSGRLVNATDNIGAPYILPFGNPEKWASIPFEFQTEFSRYCINQTIRLFCAIEETSEKVITCSDIERRVIGLPMDDTRIVDFLKGLL